MVSVAGTSDDTLTVTLDHNIPGTDMAGNVTELVASTFWSSARANISARESNSVTTETTCGLPNDGTMRIKEGRWVYLEHNADYIDQPTEWHLNPSTGILTYQAPDGVNPNNCLFTAPKLEKLVVIKGSKADPVQNIVFRQLSFKHTGW